MLKLKKLEDKSLTDQHKIKKAKKKFKKEKALSEHYQYIWSSGKILEFTIRSMISR